MLNINLDLSVDNEFAKEPMMKQHSILLVYDDPQMLKAIGWALEDKGCQVTTASEKDEAIDLLNRNIFDLVLTDLVMKPFDGVDVLRKAKDINPETMVILLGCRETFNYDHENLPHEADEFVFTPCGIPKLWKRVSNCFEKLEFKRKNLQNEMDFQQLKETVSKTSKRISEDIRNQMVSLGNDMVVLSQGTYGKIEKKAAHRLRDLVKRLKLLVVELDDCMKKMDIFKKNKTKLLD